MTGRDDPMPLRDAVAALGRRLGLPAPDVVATLHARWPELVGPAIAQHARVRSVHDGVCTIEVDGPAFATRFRYKTSDLVGQLNECCGGPVVDSVRVVVATPRPGPRKAR